MSPWFVSLARGRRGRVGADTDRLAEPLASLFAAVLDPAGGQFPVMSWVFEGGAAPVYDREPVFLEGPSGPRPVYRLAIGLMTPESLERLILHLSRTWRWKPKDVRRELESAGAVLGADEVARTIRVPGDGRRR